MASDVTAPADAPAAAAEAHNPSTQPAPATMTQINLDLRLEKPTNGKTYPRKTSDGSAQEISIEVYEAMLGQNFSDLALAKEEDSEIEWGDMDPEAASNLQFEMVKAYKTLKNPRKLARLDPTTKTSEATPHANLRPPSCEPSLPDTITMDNLKQIITKYHEETVQPSIELVSNHVRQEITTRLASLGAQTRISNLTLQSIESEQQRRTVLIHNALPFSSKAVVDSNTEYLLEQAG